MNLIQLSLLIVCLPHQAYLQLDAAIRTLYRVFFSKKNLLEWQTAADVEQKTYTLDKVSAQTFWVPISLASVVALLILFTLNLESLPYASAFLLCWYTSPSLIKKLSKNIEREKTHLNPQQITLMRQIVRKTWHYFECFAGPQENWLVPDNFQEDPRPTIAHRTSPTNMGLLLLSTCSAYDFGYLCANEMLRRLHCTLHTMAKLERRHGHFYNWYDTLTLTPLAPKYISTVDSGNLAGHLIAVKQTCLSIIDEDIIKSSLFSGLNDTLSIISEKILSLKSNSKMEYIRRLEKCFYGIDGDHFLSVFDFQFHLKKTKDILQSISRDVASESNESLNKWIHNCLETIRIYLNHFNHFLPWKQEQLQQLDRYIKENKPQYYEEWENIYSSLDFITTFRKWLDLCHRGQSLLDQATQRDLQKEKVITLFQQLFTQAINATEDLYRNSQQVADTCHKFAQEMDFEILYNRERKIFTIGYNITDGRLDASYYDLLASESRLASFWAIAKGTIAQAHWFHLGRQMTSVFKKRALISWSASMFEYLMPLLVMKNYSGTLLDETHHAVVMQQITYGTQNNIPWGISESAYNARDMQMNYQYGPFGVPGLGLKRGLVDNLVISPYSSALAAMITPREALANMKRFISLKILTDYGFYEAIDYTKERLPPGDEFYVIRNFMAHHQGMIITSLNNVLNNNIMQKRFHKDLMIRSTELLLQERIPKKVMISHPRAEEVHLGKAVFLNMQSSLRYIDNLETDTPITQILSNGNYSTMLTAAGSGYSRRKNIHLTRWHEDAILDQQGQYLFIRDEDQNKFWSSCLQPFNTNASSYRTSFSEHKVEFWCDSDKIASHTEIVIAPEDSVELRRLTLTNYSGMKKNLSVTSYLEPTLLTHAADTAHPAFGNLFIEIQYIDSKNALLARRRPRSERDPQLWAFHLVSSEPSQDYAVEFETHRENFIGRGRNISSPKALLRDTPLSNTQGAVLDPVFSLRKHVKLKEQASVKLCFVSGITDSREEALRLIDQYHDIQSFEREDEMSWTKCQAELRHLNITVEEAENYQTLASALLFPCGPMRANKTLLKENTRSQSALWAYGIGGDLPLAVVIVKNNQDLFLFKQLLRAHEYLRLKNFPFELVAINANLESSSYRQDYQEELLYCIRMAGQQHLLGKAEGLFLLKKDALPIEDLNLLQSVARAYFVDNGLSLKEELERINSHSLSSYLQDELTIEINREKPKFRSIPLVTPKLILENDFGGFTPDGKEYVIRKPLGLETPAPWINVIANAKDFGFIVTERGSSCTWSQNSRENRLTPWSNDPVSDPSGEVIYLHEPSNHLLATLTPAPLPGPEPFIIKHGAGYSEFLNNNFELVQKLTVFCHPAKDLKLNRINIRNESSTPRSFSLIYYVELVLGFHRSQTAPHVVTELIESKSLILARNRYNEDFGKRITFVASNYKLSSFTCDRKSFLGRHGNKMPKIKGISKLNGHVGAGLDPCVALKIDLKLAPGEEKEIVFMLGQATTTEDIDQCLEECLESGSVQEILTHAKRGWDRILEKIQIKTKYPEFDVLINRWLLYQNLSCRIWARTAFYQSGGAYGFRDQLQDVTALLFTAPEIAKEQILKAAAHQFKEGDVLHWWHPPSSKGVRTHFSDDLVWLAFVTCAYLKATGDYSLLDEQVSFIEGPELALEKEDLYFHAQVSSESASVYEHCARTLDRSLSVGAHGLPLMGTGDWNDGMNQVGAAGKGESVWMAWFLINTLNSFIPIAQKMEDTHRVVAYKDHVLKLSKAVEDTGWDGNWYRRAYFDDGSPLGSLLSDECKIDSLSQSWAALSAAAREDRLAIALNSLKDHLIKEEEGLVLLFTPPFDKTSHNPGYIKGYVPGVRENGGQYTHAAIWAAMAFAAIGNGEQAFKIMSILNPINHALTQAGCQKYKVEPYAIAADVYRTPGKVGRGGWTWYTGSAGWYYRGFVESILGIKVEQNQLFIQPCLPSAMSEYQVSYRFGESEYQITVVKKGHEYSIMVDNKTLNTLFIPLKDEERVYKVLVTIAN